MGRVNGGEEGKMGKNVEGGGWRRGGDRRGREKMKRERKERRRGREW